LTGEPLQVAAGGDALLILVSRNYGYYLECLDARTGGRRWLKPRSLGTQPVDLDGAVVDGTAVYGVQNRALSAYVLADGGLLWKSVLPSFAEHWRILRTRNCLLAFPCDRPAVRWQVRWPLAGEVRLTVPRPSGSAEVLPILVYDPPSGRLQERLNFPAPPGELIFGYRPYVVSGLVPRISRRAATLPESVPAVQVTERGVLVAWRGRAWGLTEYVHAASAQ
jgi:hypothetical protein